MLISSTFYLSLAVRRRTRCAVVEYFTVERCAVARCTVEYCTIERCAVGAAERLRAVELCAVELLAVKLHGYCTDGYRDAGCQNVRRIRATVVGVHELPDAWPLLQVCSRPWARRGMRGERLTSARRWASWRKSVRGTVGRPAFQGGCVTAGLQRCGRDGRLPASLY